MAIDLRADVTCNLGTLISATISDDYIQGNGLVRVTGSCEISGIITPNIGDVVTFSYVKNGVTRSIPRKLRVLSSFADPFRRITSVELGCKLTYLQDLREVIDWSGLDDPINLNYGWSITDGSYVPIAIHASSIMDECLSQLELTASSSPLTNKFSVSFFDFSPGYVNILSDLLISESYCGYLDFNEVLQIFSVDQDGGTGPVLTSARIIDLGPIGVGDLPGEAVTVNYSSIIYNGSEFNVDYGAPIYAINGDPRFNWDNDQTSKSHSVSISYEDQATGTTTISTYNVLDTSTTTSYYESINTPDGESKRVTTRRSTEETTISVNVLGGLATQYLTNGFAVPTYTVFKNTEENYSYDAFGNEIFYSKYVSGSTDYLVGSLGIDFVYNGQTYSPPSGSCPISLEQRTTYTAGDYQLVKTYVYGPWSETIAGQQTIANSRESIQTVEQAESYVSSLIGGGLSLVDVQITTRRTTESGRAPEQAEIINSAFSDTGGYVNAALGGTAPKTTELILALGSVTAQRFTEFSLPYAPDDSFDKVYPEFGSVSPIYYAPLHADAAAKANQFGRVQNRLLAGNRNGINLQVAPEDLPSNPFAPVIVQANGLSALYRINGTNWTIDASGIVASTDALFWGAVGGTGTFWFPVAPGITTLPSTPPVVDGQMTVSSVVPIWNETLVADARVRTGLVVQGFDYGLQALTEVDPITLNIGLQAAKITRIGPPIASIALNAQIPSILADTVISTPSLTVSVASPVPAVSGGAIVNIYDINISLTALEPISVGTIATLVSAPASDLLVAAGECAIFTGAAIISPFSSVTLEALAPAEVGDLSVKVPVYEIALSSQVPVLAISVSVGIPVISLLLEVPVITIDAKTNTIINVPSADIGVDAQIPAIAIDVLLDVPVSGLTISQPAPSIETVIVDQDIMSVKLLLHADGVDNSTTITDSSLGNLTASVLGSTKLSTAQQKFGTASINFNSGTNANITYTSNDLDITLGQDFTWEFWAYVTAATTATGFGSTYYIMESQGGADVAISLKAGSGGSKYWAFARDNSSGWDHQNAIVLNQWQHVALVRSSNVLNLYVDGVKSTTSSTINSDYDNSVFFSIGPRQSGSSNMLYMDEVRVTIGVARYTANFTPQQTPFYTLVPSLTGVSIGAPSSDIQLAALAPASVGPVTRVVGSFINSDADPADTTHVLTTPSYAQGDLLVAVFVWRSTRGTVTVPSGWSLHGTYGQDGDAEEFLVYTKTATASEPASYTWTATSSVRNAGFIASVRSPIPSTTPSITGVTQHFSSTRDITIPTVDERLNITAFCWGSWTSLTALEYYSQTSTTTGLTQITDSPKLGAMISGAHIYGQASISGTHTSPSATEGICIQIA